MRRRLSGRFGRPPGFFPKSSATTCCSSLTCGSVTINFLSSRAFLDGKPLELTGAEYRLLGLLLRNAGRVVTRDAILNELWDEAGSFVDDNTLSVYVRRLRKKVEADPSNPRRIITVRGFGYQWKEEV